MKVSSLGILGLGIILAAPATAQTLEQGKWTGSLQLSPESAERVTQVSQRAMRSPTLK